MTECNPSESRNLLVESARYHYHTTEKRWDYLISKAQVLLTTSSLLAAIFSFIKQNKGCSEILNYISQGCALISILILIYILQNKESKRPAMENINADHDLKKKPDQVATDLINSYLASSKESDKAVGGLYKKYQWAVNFVFGAAFIKIISLTVDFFSFIKAR